MDWRSQIRRCRLLLQYGMLQPYLTPDGGGALSWASPEERYPTREHWVAAAANLYTLGVDGVYSYLASWPHDELVCSMLREVAPARKERLRLAHKRYRFDEHDQECADELSAAGLPLYPWVLPLEIPEANQHRRYTLPFLCADDLHEYDQRLVLVQLYVTVDNLCSADDFEIYLNDRPLHSEPMRRTWGLHHARMLGAARTSTRPPTSGGPGLAMALTIDMQRVRPMQGWNTLEFCLAGRPDGLGGGARVHQVEIKVQYLAYPSRL
jgi:hypothetical protein